MHLELWIWSTIFGLTWWQAQLREITLQEENVEYEKTISDYENRIQEKSQEADLLRTKLQVSHNSWLITFSRGSFYDL